ncbi:hypothetical protein I2712_002480 [Vibrio fluvialis]|nr:hypothetical protein [Vibrio fluvialis]
MDKQLQLSLNEQLHSSRSKFCYFLMIAAGSAIGFALTQTKAETFTAHYIIWSLTIIVWGLSFLCGAKYIVNLNEHTHMNLGYILGEETKDYVKDKSNHLNSKLNFYGNFQSYLLLIGAVFYIWWFIMNILATSATT